MSEENVDLLKDMLSRWNGGERTFADEIQPDTEILSRGHMEGRSLRGHEGVRRWFRENHGGEAPITPSERQRA